MIGLEDVVGDSEMVVASRPPRSFSLKELAEGMITVSDNTATNLLISRRGMDGVNALARSLGMEHTVLRRHMMDFDARSRGEENLTSARDMVTLLAEIQRGTLLSPASRELAISFLLDQRLISRIPVRIPNSVRFAHKTGELPGIEHDAGIVTLPDTGAVFAIAVLTEGDPSLASPRLTTALSLLHEAFSR